MVDRHLCTVLALTVLLTGCDGGAAPEVATPSPSAPGPPAFTDVTHGDTDSIVKLHAFDPDAASVVVEPTLLMTGEEYCAAFAVPAGPGAPCDMTWTAEDSRVKVTLPVDDDAELATARGAEPACRGTMTGGATCPVPRDAFVTWLTGREEQLVRLTTKRGTVVRMAEISTP